jgi:hypothetical protein
MIPKGKYPLRLSHLYSKLLYRSHRGAIFMEQNMRFGLILGRLAILKKKLGAFYEQLLSKKM